MISAEANQISAIHQVKPLCCRTFRNTYEHQVGAAGRDPYWIPIMEAESFSQNSPIHIDIDVQFAILEHLDESHTKDTIASCAMLNHEWLSVFRPALFRSITVKPHADKRLSSFIDFLLSHPDVAAYIQELVLSGEAAQSLTDRYITVREYQAVMATLSHLRKLRLVSLVIGNQFLSATPHPEMEALPHGPVRPLQSLHIDDCDSIGSSESPTWTHDPRPLLDILCASLSINNLTIDNTCGSNLYDKQSTHHILSALIEPQHRPQSPTVHTLVLNSIRPATAAILHAYLAYTGSLEGPLTTLRVGRFGSSKSFPLFYFPMLWDTRAHLTELHLCAADVTCDLNPGLYQRTIDHFASLVALQTLVFWVCSSFGRPGSQLTMCTPLLKPPNLRTLSFKLDPGDALAIEFLSRMARLPSPQASLLWGELDEALHGIKTLRAAEFAFYNKGQHTPAAGEDHFEPFRRTFERCFPMTLERGILRVRHMPGQSYGEY
ncbi:hypothetical protein BD309DRAFT_963989 [Dichomitus squalens]|uniref:Uncharacterized protein n=1 Tax=Dichomitus squalens TaxID=114155 RepID=A0A4V2K8L5_9APHY|nr:hypothetical protein BD309DRAFT_963989 [Dichomitus squalens]TBU60368.1 hypothetical protein BD310DRAFT_957651 [Dichomitus squalens]